MAITIEQEPPSIYKCDCCGGASTKLTRFVNRDGDAYAAYKAVFASNHPVRSVQVLLGMGEWGDDASPEQRVAFALDLRILDGAYAVMVLNREASAWRDTTFLGRILDREQALTHPLIDEVFQLTDQMFSEDMPIRDYLDSPAA